MSIKNQYQDSSIKELKGDMKDIRFHFSTMNKEHGILKNDVKWLKDEFKTNFPKMRTAIDEINNKLNKRPTWLLTLSFGALLSIVTGLIVYVITN